MAPEDNWLSFSLSPMAMLSSSTSQPQMLQSNMKLAPFDGSSSGDSQQYYFFDNFYTNGWPNTKPQVMYSGENQVQDVPGQNIADSSIFTSFVDSHIKQQSAPKLEDFLGGDSASLVRYSDSQTETQDSELTHIYGQSGSAYFNDQQDLKTIAAFRAFSTNSGSEVDDSGSVARTQLGSSEFAGQCFESRNELAYSQCPNGALSLGVNVNTNAIKNSEKAIVPVESDSCKKIADTFGQRTSIYRGVTRHRWTGRYEAHLWDNSCRREGQARKGRQVYLGGYDKEDKAARAYDLAALKYWGSSATTNFPISNYTREVEEMKNATKQEFIASLRRKSSGFSRGASIYRGVTRHHQQGRWQARIGRVAGNKDLYLGTFATEEEAAEAYDIAAIKFRGLNAVTNFEMNRYDVEAIAKSALPIGGGAKRLKISLEAEKKPSLTNHHQQQQPPQCSSGNNISFSAVQPVSSIPYGVPFDSAMPLYHQHQQQQHHYQQHHHQQLYHHLQSAGSDASGAALSLLPPPAEFFIWPHQSY